MPISNTPLKPDHALILRLAVGAIFGAAIALLMHLTTGSSLHGMPSWAQVLMSTLLLGAFVIWAGAGVMRRVSLAVWSVIALCLIAVIAWHRLASDGHDQFNPLFFSLSFLVYPFLFISHELVASADQSGKWIAPYPVYNDEAWQRGVQLALALAFTGLFWAILGLGALLFHFIGFDWFGKLIFKPIIAYPLSGLALGASVHMGDSQPKLVAGLRALVLSVLSWLLPVLTVIGLLFGIGLCFSGLKPLWDTKAASMTLLGACTGLALLINAAYQQGDADRKVHVVLKIAARVACGLLLAFALLAAYSLHLRIHQYGLTPERVLAAVGVFIAVLYGLGYAYAAVVPKGRWLAGVETINLGMAVIMALTFLAVLTPLADPQRLSVASQVARLQSGKTAPDKFDWDLLYNKTGAEGKKAVASLIKTGKTQAIKDAAKVAGAAGPDPEPYPFSKPDLSKIPVVTPKGGALPADFIAQDFSKTGSAPDCLYSIDNVHVLPCTAAAMLDLDHDGAPEVLVLNGTEVAIFTHGKDGWVSIATLYTDNDTVEAFKAGKFSQTKHRFDDVHIGDYNRGSIDNPAE
jgi:hypothetical protein